MRIETKAPQEEGQPQESRSVHTGRLDMADDIYAKMKQTVIDGEVEEAAELGWNA